VGRTEAEIAQDIFEHIAAGSSAVLEAKRLQALGVPSVTRFAGGKELIRAGAWKPDRIAKMIRNPAYEGCHVMRTKAGLVERPTAALVSVDLWQRANDQLTRNQLTATRNAKHSYLLRGLIQCGICGRSYVGTTGWVARNVDGLWYRCNGQVSSREAINGSRCTGKAIRADVLEAEVWAGCRDFIFNPGPALAEAQERLRVRLEQSADLDQQRRALQQQLDRKQAEREPVLTLARRGHISLAEAEGQLDAIAHEMADLRQMIDALGAEAALTAAGGASHRCSRSACSPSR
jgi:site-specific DNA recombinase